MSGLNVSLFGRLDICIGDRSIATLEKVKVQELLCYLLLHRHRIHTRESLAALLWQDASPEQARCYLRKALWQLQSALLAEDSLANHQLLTVEKVWIGINPVNGLWLDVAVVEEAYESCEGIRGDRLNEEQVCHLKQAADVYKGDLLEGWYDDWCMYERERLQRMYLIILDKLVENCIACGEYEMGLSFGLRILEYDIAHERTHRHLMRLYYLAGDRTKSLRQFEKCETLLQKELGVTPSRRTMALYDEIQAEQMPSAIVDTSPFMNLASQDTLDWLEHLHTDLCHLQRTVQQNIHTVEAIMAVQDRCKICVE